MSDILFLTKKVVLELIGNLYCVMYLDNEKHDLCTIETYLSSLNPIDLMNYLVEHLLPQQTNIETRNKDFFVGNHMLFEPLNNPDSVVYYSNVFTDSSRVTDEDEAVIFSYFDTILSFVVSYKKLK